MSPPRRIRDVRVTALALALIVPFLGCAETQPEIHALGEDVWVRIAPVLNELGTNQGWIEFDDFVLIVDADVKDRDLVWIEERRAYSDKPIRYVVNTHFHGDHTHGNARLTALGAQVVATSALRKYAARMGQDFDKGSGQQAYRGVEFVGPSVWFDDRWTLDDGEQRVDLLHLGPAHTAADTLIWLPKPGVLFTGDVAASDHVTYLGDADLDGWVAVLEELTQLPVRTVVPGHGPIGGPEVLEKQLSFIRDLRTAIDRRIDAGDGAEQIAASLTLERHPEWAEQAHWFRLIGVEQHVKKRLMQASRGSVTGLPD